MECIFVEKENADRFLSLLPEREKEFLDKTGNCRAIGAVCGEEAAGILLFCESEDSLFMRYIAVSDVYRRKGIAKGMIRFLCEYADRDIMLVISAFYAEDKTDPVYLLFAELDNFTVYEEEQVQVEAFLEKLSGNHELGSKDDGKDTLYFAAWDMIF